MTTFLMIIGVLVLLYVALVKWQMAKPRRFVYSPHLAPILRRCCPGMVAVTAWHTCWLFMPDGTPGWELAPHGMVHERTHMEQFDAHPYLMPFLYLWEQLRHGYRDNKFEIAARVAAGEPPRGAA